jgi:putative ABC transport system permease protein
MGEAGLLTLLGVVTGLVLLYLLLLLGQPVIEGRFGIHIALGGLAAREWQMLGGIVLAGCLVGAIPAYRAYRLSLADGLAPRV